LHSSRGQGFDQNSRRESSRQFLTATSARKKLCETCKRYPSTPKHLFFVFLQPLRYGFSVLLDKYGTPLSLCLQLAHKISKFKFAQVDLLCFVQQFLRVFSVRNIVRDAQVLQEVLVFFFANWASRHSSLPPTLIKTFLHRGLHCSFNIATKKPLRQ